MSFLLDTHVLIWTIVQRNKIPQRVLEEIEDVSNQIFVSAISIWEIGVKFSVNKLDIHGFSPVDLPEFCRRMGFLLLPLTPQEASQYHYLPILDFHKDPFDRMLIHQAITKKLTIISADKNFAHYKDQGLKVLW